MGEFESFRLSSRRENIQETKKAFPFSVNLTSICVSKRFYYHISHVAEKI